MHVSTCALLASTDRTKKCGPAIIISGTVICKARIYSESVTGCCHAFQHTHCLICSLPTQHPPVQADNDHHSTTAAAGERPGQHPNAIPMRTAHVTPVNRGVRILKVWSVSVHRVWPKIHIRRPSNMQSRVCSEATSECYPTVTVQTCMIKC